jgi:molybdopterin/thiamine biosynthesis adenylyltransferase
MDANEYYQAATQRNIGLVSLEEQDKLRHSRVAIAGLGGGGGIYLTTLTRMGIGAFNIADYDQFSVFNTNRQVGAMQSTLGRPKAQVLAEMARDIHPNVNINLFSEGINPENIEAFLSDVDVVVDALDLFALPARQLLYSMARKKGIPVLSGAPPGFSATLHVFMPDSMSFEDYFDIRPGMSAFEMMAAFIVGVAPAGTHWSYMNTKKVEPGAKAAASSAASITLMAGLLA